MARRAELGTAHDRLLVHRGRGEGFGERSTVGAFGCIASHFMRFCISRHDCFQVVKCEREVGFLLKLMAVAGGDVYLTR